MNNEKRTYKVLKNQVFTSGNYRIVPIRDKDKYDIMKWRNEQMYHLRQNQALSRQEQESYFKNTINQLFNEDFPSQILFSFLEKEQCIGYGGLVHIDWNKKTAELSFIMDTSLEKNFFEKLWLVFVKLIKKVAFDELSFNYIFTYAFDVRPHLYPVLQKAGFELHQRLKEEVFINGKKTDVLIHRLMQ